VQQAKAAGERSYELLKHRNERDIALYRSERSMAFCFMILKLAEAQEALQGAVAAVWQAMATKAGADLSAFGPGGVQDVAYADLGEQVSHSAVVIEDDVDVAGSSVGPSSDGGFVAAGPVPTEVQGASSED
jgi:hypothetical protein